MALTVALKIDDTIFLAGERRIRYGGKEWESFIQVNNYYIAIANPLYHSVIFELRNRIVIQNLGSIKLIDILYENLQEILKISHVESPGDQERYKLEMIVCTQKNIWKFCVSGSITEEKYAIIGESNTNIETLHGYILGMYEFTSNKRKNSKKLIRTILTRYAETGGKIKIQQITK